MHCGPDLLLMKNNQKGAACVSVPYQDFKEVFGYFPKKRIGSVHTRCFSTQYFRISVLTTGNGAVRLWQREHSSFPPEARVSGISWTCQREKHSGSTLQIYVILCATQVYVINNVSNRILLLPMF